MRSRFVLIVALLGCGGPDFTGTWRGTGTRAEVCSNGNSQTLELSFEWFITQSGGEVSATPDGGTCGALVGDLEGSTVELRAKTCEGGAAVERGKLTLESSDAMRVSVKSTFPLTATSCSATTTATFTRAR